MAIVTNKQPANLIAQTFGNKKDTQQQNDLWLNVGVTIVDQETGEEVFIQLPIGLGLDTLPRAKEIGFHADMSPEQRKFAELRQGQNALLDMLRMQGMDLEPGTSIMLKNLDVQLLRRRIVTEEPAVESSIGSAILEALKA